MQDPWGGGGGGGEGVPNETLMSYELGQYGSKFSC